MNNLNEFIQRRISHCKKRINLIKQNHGDKPNEKYNYYGGQELGYWQGMLSAYENTLDEIDDLNELKMFEWLKEAIDICNDQDISPKELAKLLKKYSKK